MVRRLLPICLVALLPAPALPQTPGTQELLALVPREFGFCAVMHDLRGHWQRLEDSPWFKQLKATTLGKTVSEAPEFRALAQFERDLKQYLDLDWSTLRDDLLGEAVVFAFRPAAGDQADEDGLFMLKAREAATLQRLIERLNELQRQAGELKVLEPRQHEGETYYRRVHDRNTHFYWQRGAVLAISSKEEIIKAVIAARSQSSAPIYRALQRAGAADAVLALWVDPRVFDEELRLKADALGDASTVLQRTLADWKRIESAVISVDIEDDLEARLTLLGHTSPDRSPPTWLEKSPEPSELWSQFPSNSILVLAARTDFRGVFDSLSDLAPANDRKHLVETAQKTLGAALGLDPVKEGLPNIGPNWGLCILPADAKQPFPQALFALAVKAAPKDAPTDQAIYRALQFFVGLALFEYNRTHDHPIRMRTVQQEGVEVKYLVNDQLFPAGFQPALALKDGYLLIATSPEAIQQFRKHEGASPSADEVVYLRFLPQELAKFLEQHRNNLISHLAKKQQSEASRTMVEASIEVLRLFRQVTVSQTVGDRRFALIVRVQPVK